MGRKKIMAGKMVIVLIGAAGVVWMTAQSYAGICVERSGDDCARQELAHAEHKKEAAGEKPRASAEGKRAEDAVNTICPVSGEKLDETAKLTYEYKGKVYALCCQVCLEEFKKDPESYIEKMEKGTEGGQEQSLGKGHHGHKELPSR